jgi:hypothetical protein
MYPPVEDWATPVTVTDTSVAGSEFPILTVIFSVSTCPGETVATIPALVTVIPGLADTTMGMSERIKTIITTAAERRCHGFKTLSLRPWCIVSHLLTIRILLG